MRKKSLEDLIALGAQASSTDPFAAAIRDATEGEFVSARFLKQALENAGLEVKETPRNVLTRVDVLKGETQIAYGESHDASDALLQAALGYLRELPQTA